MKTSKVLSILLVIAMLVSILPVAVNACDDELTRVKASVPSSGSSVLPGGEITYTITTKNDSDSTEHGVVATDVIPAGTTYVAGSADASGGVYDTATKTITWNLGDIGHHVTKTMSFKVTVNALAAGTTSLVIRNKALINNYWTNEVTHKIRRVQIIKLDGDDNQTRLAGAVFALYYKHHDNWILISNSLTTDANGEINVYNLQYDDYKVVELTPPPGYSLPGTTAVTFKIDSDHPGKILTFKNDRLSYPIEIIKLNTDGAPIEGVVFELYDKDKVLLPGTLTTDALGVATTGALKPGSYFVKEVSVPNGYELDLNYHAVDVNINQAGGKATITIRNAFTPYYIEILKVDGRDDMTPLADVEFDLYTSNGGVPETLLESLKTLADGTARTVNTYVPGTYLLVETKAPVDFKPITDPIPVTIDIGSGVNGVFYVSAIANEFVSDPEITVSKQVRNDDQSGILADSADLYVGETAEYAVVVTNTGNVDLSNVILTDDQAVVGTDVVATPGGTLQWTAGVGGIATLNLGALAKNASITLVYSYKTISGDLARTPITNNVVVTGDMTETPDFPNGTTVDANADAVIFVSEVPLVNASILLAKSARNLTASGSFGDLITLTVGQTAQYSIVITNTSSVALSDVVLTDDLAIVGASAEVSTLGTQTWTAGVGGIATLNLGTMAAGASVTVIYDYLTVPGDIGNTLTNTASVTGYYYPDLKVLGTITVSDHNDAVVTVEDIPLAIPGLALVKQVSNVTMGGAPADLAIGKPGDLFRYTVTITNTGTTGLTALRLTDTLAVAGTTIKNVTNSTTTTWLADGSNPVFILLADLAPGASVQYTYEYTSIPADNGNTRINIAKVTASVVPVQIIGINDGLPIGDGIIAMSAQDSATIMLDEIPLSGENDNQTGIGLSLLIGGAALVLFRRRRSQDATPEEEI